MKNKKKVVSILLATAMCASLFTAMALPTQAAGVTFDEKNVAVRFGAMTDTHFSESSPGGDNEKRTTKAIEFFQQKAGGADKLDAITISGDLTDWKPKEDVKRIKIVFDATLKDTKTEVIAAAGNHDDYNTENKNFKTENFFRDAFGDYVYLNPVAGNTADDITKSNYHTVIGGVHFITVYGIDGDHPQASLTWLDEQLKIATTQTPNMPVFVATHVAPADTVYGSAGADGGRWSSKTIGRVLSKYPQAVTLTGHSHNTIVPETSLWQGGYTAIHAGVISSSRPTGYYIEVDKNGVVKVERYFLNSGDTAPQQIQQTWVFPTMHSSADAVYSIAKRQAAKDAPYFEADRKELVVDNKTVFNTAQISATFDTAKDSNMVYAYRMVVREKNSPNTLAGDTSVTTDFSGFYDPANQMPDGKQSMKLVASGLKSSTDYEVCVYAIDIFGTPSEPLVYSFKTTAFTTPTQDFHFKALNNFDYLPLDTLFAKDKNDTSGVIAYSESLASAAEITATKTGAVSGQALQVKSIKNPGGNQTISVNINHKDNPNAAQASDTAQFISFYLDTTAYRGSTSVSLTFRFTEKDAGGSVVTYGLKKDAPMLFLDNDGYTNKTTVNADGLISMQKGMRVRVMIPLSSFSVLSGTDTNGKVDAQDITGAELSFSNIGSKESILLIDDIGLSVAKNESGSAPFAPIPQENTGVLGDVNGDGSVKSIDALWILEYVAGSRVLDSAAFKRADMNGDGLVKGLDALWILNQVAGLPNK